MPRFQSLAEFLETGQLEADQAEPPAGPQLEDIADSRVFSLAVLDSREFRTYVVNALTLGTLPAAVLCRLMDYAWGKPPERVEHTGRDGRPIETVTEVKRTIVRVRRDEIDRLLEESDRKIEKPVMH